MRGIKVYKNGGDHQFGLLGAIDCDEAEWWNDKTRKDAVQLLFERTFDR